MRQALVGLDRLARKAQAELQQVMDETAADVKTRPGFKLGLSLIVLCGFDRGCSPSAPMAQN